MSDNVCPVCGGNLNIIGKRHRCIPAKAPKPVIEVKPSLLLPACPVCEARRKRQREAQKAYRARKKK